jgi:hypothetical protein
MCLFPSREQRIRQLLTLEIGDRKPSQFLRKLRSLVTDVPDDFLRSVWSSRLPAKVHAIITGQSEGDLNASVHCADRIIEVLLQQILASVSHSPTATHFSSVSKTSPVRWQQSAPSWHTFASAPGIFLAAPRNNAQATHRPPEKTLHPPSASTIGAMEPGHKSVLSHDPTANKKNYHSGYQRQHMSAPQSTVTSSSRIGSVDGDS